MPDGRTNDVTTERLQGSRGATDVIKQAASILQRELNDHADRAAMMQTMFAEFKGDDEQFLFDLPCYTVERDN